MYAADVTGENLTRTISKELQQLNLDIGSCQGQAFDGGSNMSGQIPGCPSTDKEIAAPRNRQSLCEPQANYNESLLLSLHKKCRWCNFFDSDFLKSGNRVQLIHLMKVYKVS